MNINVMMPVWNEEKCLPTCLKYLKRQSLMPDKVIVVDDGSTDSTPDILAGLGEPFFVVRKSRDYNRHYYAAVIDEASKHLDKDVDFVGILDADILLERDYYKKALGRLMDNPKLGMTGGVVLGEPHGQLMYGLPPYVFGANRVHTAECWVDINDGSPRLSPEALVHAVDTYHYLKCFLMGYEPSRFDDMLCRGLRPATQDAVRLFYRGFACYELGYYPWYLLGRAVFRLKPHYIAGFLKAWQMNASKLGPIEYTRAIELHRIKRLLHLKSDLKPVDVLKAVAKTILVYRKRGKLLRKMKYQLDES